MEAGNENFRYQRSCAIEAVIVSVFVLLDLHILHLKKRTNLQLYFYILC